MKLRYLGIFGATIMLVAACNGGGTATTAPTAPPATDAPATDAPATDAPAKGTITIGVDLPLSGADAQNGQPTLKGVRLAVDEVNQAGGIDGWTLDLNIQDHVRDGQFNPDQGAANMRVLVQDANVVASVGPYNTSVARVQIPITNEAGLLQCSPANTGPGLTKPEFGALDLRTSFPDRISYIRVATTDDVQGPAGASYAYNNLELRNVLVVDDTTTFGVGVADEFEKEFKRLGGNIVQRQGKDPAPPHDFISILTEAAGLNPDGVFYGGVTSSGGAVLRRQMAQANLGDLPYVGPDGVVDGPGSSQGTWINIAGDSAANSFGTIAAIGDFPDKANFDARFIEAFKGDSEFNTPGAYSGPAYACTQVIIESIRASVAAGADPADKAGFREAVRAHATSGAVFETVLGRTSFDENGDNTAKFISFYAVDMDAAEGAGDWIFESQENFGE